MRQYRVLDVYWADLVDAVCFLCGAPMTDPQTVVAVYVHERPVGNVPTLEYVHVKCAIAEGV